MSQTSENRERQTMKLTAAGLVFWMVCPALAGEPSEWPQWRGPARTCEITASRWPESISEQHLVEQYRIPLGPGYSGPLVASDAVFVTETVNKEKEVVKALDRSTGRELWKAEWPGAMSVPFFAAANGSWIRATPLFDSERLYVSGMLDELVALDRGTGKEVWRVDFKQAFGTKGQTFGAVCSPLLEGDSLFIQTSGGLCRIRCRTGELAWRSLNEDGGMMGGAFSSPVIATIAGSRQLVVQTRAKLCGVDPESGKELWSAAIPSFRDMNILTPTVTGDRIFTSSYGGGATMFEVTEANGVFSVREVWKNTTEAYMSSPVVIGGRIYLHLRNKRFTCLDPATGETLWRTTPFGDYWSMVVNGTQLLALDSNGDLILVDANPAEFSKVDSRHLSDASTWAHLAVVDDQVFVRALDGLIVYRWK